MKKKPSEEGKNLIDRRQEIESEYCEQQQPYGQQLRIEQFEQKSCEP